MSDFKVDIDKVLASSLGFEAYFVLYCLYTKNKDLLVKYAKRCKPINTDIFRKLQEDGFINIKAYHNDNIHYELLSLTSKGQDLLLSSSHTDNPIVDGQPYLKRLESNFEEFRTFYPNTVKQGFKTRKLHGNLKKCRSLYEKLLMETTHDVLCQCAKLYYEEKHRSGDEIYMQNLETWLSQKNYLQYIEDVNNTATKGSFTDDI